MHPTDTIYIQGPFSLSSYCPWCLWYKHFVKRPQLHLLWVSFSFFSIGDDEAHLVLTTALTRSEVVSGIRNGPLGLILCNMDEPFHGVQCLMYGELSDLHSTSPDICAILRFSLLSGGNRTNLHRTSIVDTVVKIQMSYHYRHRCLTQPHIQYNGWFF